MGTYIIMLFIMAFLGFELIIGAKTIDDTHFFNKDNTNALRGFWCLIIILVHVPAAYQNKMQDMIGSFAYIGVTFFFMTSAYGLRLSVEKGKNVNGFWRRRLPKLLIPCLLVNIIRILFNIIEGSEFSVWNFVTINGWVLWLLVCYLIFWTSYKFIGGGIRI